MFQPNPIPPTIIKSVTPPWVLAAIIATQIVLNVVSVSPEPKCTLEVEYPHHSRSMERDMGIDAIKINIKSECNVPQLYTEVDASIESKVGEVVTTYVFARTREPADSKDPKTAYFKRLFKFCAKGKGAEYKGAAIGTVHLRNGRDVDVSDKNLNYFPQNCRITAK
jgi:hypothetical protein